MFTLRRIACDGLVVNRQRLVGRNHEKTTIRSEIILVEMFFLGMLVTASATEKMCESKECVRMHC